ncbi:TPA: N-acetylmuramoyl-L-alanine amidase [Clostridium perfringens]|nr:N-acetylmuramoyl-L-alanine amidase [Clostridium perfringens]
MRIGIDKGHAIKGVRGASAILDEVNENRKIGNRLIEMLKEKGHTVVDCSCDVAYDVNEQLAGIVSRANRQYLDLFVSIHLNSGGGHGTETYTLPNPNESTKAKAKAINDAVASSCGFSNRGLKTARFYVLRKTIAPAILVEVCFTDSQEDANKINVEAVAKALFKGITGTEYDGSSDSNPSAPAGYGIVTASVLNVRKGAGTQYPVIGQLKKGDRVKLDVKVGQWWSTYYGEHGGFVHGNYILVN